jgi:glucose-1-phosphate cytidylyltransferase
MKVVLLAGGLGTRISEETSLRPKPMIEIGGKPLLWHIMKIYSKYNINEFIICCGYKGYIIKEYFSNYFLHNSDVKIDIQNNSIKVLQKSIEPWLITLVDTGEDSMTGGRLKRVRNYIGDDDFCMTYGDGLSSIDIQSLIDFHKSHGKKATVTAVQPSGRFGALEIQNNIISAFIEKPVGDGGWINGGFFVLKPDVIELIDDDRTAWEDYPLKALVSKGELMSFKHSGFWQPMDTMRDKIHLEELWQSGKAPWKVWL